MGLIVALGVVLLLWPEERGSQDESIQTSGTVLEDPGDVQQKMEEIKKDLVNYVNSKVNRFSKISKVVDNEGEFEKTPTKKIRRFIYDRSNKGENQEGENQDSEKR